MSGERQVPLYCPYCGDEDLRPAGPIPGEWRCGACARAFGLRFGGLSPASPAGEPPARRAAANPGGPPAAPGPGAGSPAGP